LSFTDFVLLADRFQNARSVGQEWSIHVAEVGISDHDQLSRSRALDETLNVRIMATSATFAGFPELNLRLLKPKLKRTAASMSVVSLPGD
jgi:hypothetical protein